MNKKFSTLLAAVALFGAVSANAATVVDTTIKLSEAGNKTLYQIGLTGGGFLTINETGKLDTVNTVNSNNLASTLWCVTVHAGSQGQAPKYDFQNKGTGLYLDVTMDGLKGLCEGELTTDSVAVGGEIGGWAFSNVFANGVETEKPVFSHFTNDSIVALALDSTTGRVALVKELGSKAKIDSLTETFSLRIADPIELNAAEINTVLGTQDAKEGVNLTFDPDVVGTDLANPFKKGAFYTQDVAAETNFVYVLSKDSSFLAIDTTYTNRVGAAKFLNYKWYDLKGAKKGIHETAADSIAKNVLKEQFKYLFTYYPSVDRLVVRVKEVIFQKGTAPFFGTLPTKSVFISLQELVTDKTRILTVDSVAQNTTISFGYTGCGVVASNKTSVADGLYYVMNSKGQYLASPINLDGTGAVWTSVKADEQNVADMPAYQWVVLKDRTSSDYVKSISSVTVTNREYANLKNVYQLNKKAGASYFYIDGSSDSLSFVKIEDAKILGNTLLGYRNFLKDELSVTNYTFNYLHPYTKDKFIAKVEGDSLLNVLAGKGLFGIEPATVDVNGNSVHSAYGFRVTAAVQARIKGLQQLYRTPYKAYALNAKGDSVYIGVGAEHRYAVSASDGFANSFFFKENNELGGTCYYALVDTTTVDHAGAAFISKVGVADQDMAALLLRQIMGETRTSAFAIGLSDVPLYRRFDSAELEGNAGDATDSLRFVEKYRGEVLQVEANPSFTVAGLNLLGIDRSDKATSGIAFIVDTAWVKRGLGCIKPQYLISMDRKDVVAVPAVPCEVPGHGMNCEHVKPATPGFARGQFLVNFADSAATSGNKENYKWKGYSRAGFVDALHIGDSLYLMIDQFAGVANSKVDTAAIIKANKIANGRYIKNLTGDNHKYVTWSMRYLNPFKAANEIEADRLFLFESTGNKDIAPNVGSWLKMQNGCLVLSDYAASEFDKMTEGDDALLFNVKHVADDKLATDNEEINTTVVSVVAGEGQVVVKNAANKTVIISNILGRTIASTVITSDNATIAVPAGIVVVAVEGEVAVKTIIK